MSIVRRAPSAAAALCVVSTVYTSEGHAAASLEVLRRHISSSAKEARLVSSFSDEAYARSSVCVGGSPLAVESAVLAVASEALDRIKMRCGTHPALGSVDHISVHPVGDTAMAEAAGVARRIANGLSAKVDVLLYGAAHDEGRSLAETRRATTYFEARPAPEKPLLCCGASPHVLNYNIQLAPGTTLAQARRIAAAVRTRGGGDLEGVEALALAHGTAQSSSEPLFEVACNLLHVDRSPPSLVLAKARATADTLGVRLGTDYVIGLTYSDIRRLLVDGIQPIAPPLASPPGA